MVSKSKPVHSPSLRVPLAAAYGAPVFFAQALYRLVASRAPPAEASISSVGGGGGSNSSPERSSVGASPASGGQYLTIASRMERRCIFEKSSSVPPYLTEVEPVMFFANSEKSCSFISMRSR